MTAPTARVRRVEVLVGPLVTFMAVLSLLGVARFYDRLPVRPPECGFKSTFGIPCVSCGGTRSAKALSRGRVVEALGFNPAVVIGSFVSFLWLLFGLRRFFAGAAPLPVPEHNRRIRRVALVTLILLALNWVYLILFLK
jgi:hypothetical protein